MNMQSVVVCVGRGKGSLRSIAVSYFYGYSGRDDRGRISRVILLCMLARLSQRFTPFLVFIFSITFFSLLQPWGQFRDPDGFYHAKLAALMIGPIEPITTRFAGLSFLQNFPWLDLTSLHQHFADQHLLYHLALLPFIKLFGMLPGTQLAGVIFSATFITIFYYLVRSTRVSHPLLWTFLALVSMPLSLRLSLIKATPFALTAFVLGLYSISTFHVSRFTLDITAFAAGLLFSLAHGGWIILPVSQILFLIGTKLFERYVNCSSNEQYKYRPYTIIGLTIAGIALGLLIHPNRTNLLTFLKVQVLQVAVATPTSISLGLEWGPVEPLAFLANIGPLATAAFLILLGLILAARHPLDLTRARTSVGLGIVVAALFAFTLKNGRMVEYFIPVAILWLATLWSLIDHPRLFKDIKTQLAKLQPTRPRLGLYLLVIMLTTLFIRDIQGTYQALRSNAYPFHRFDPIADALRSVAKPGDRIFHDRWDAFGELFAHAPEFRFISGVDPTFLLAANHDLALVYEDTTPKINDPVDPKLATPIMLFQRTDKCRAPSKEIIARTERTILCR